MKLKIVSNITNKRKIANVLRCFVYLQHTNRYNRKKSEYAKSSRKKNSEKRGSVRYITAKYLGILWILLDTYPLAQLTKNSQETSRTKKKTKRVASSRCTQSFHSSLSTADRSSGKEKGSPKLLMWLCFQQSWKFKDAFGHQSLERFIARDNGERGLEN
ncbi:hypothetical protein CDAR_569531 [Caerostris darwini]|uniref:Uncharacterized protein n=1 Tax=Caerostris darwini TaxID=1538125 RepID=A0AAV4TYF0_9ARAC|nr:hypothetical protein CDAR_569531 [Caerostris darwini]